MDVAPEVAPRPTTQPDPLPQEQWVISIREKLKKAQQYAAERPWEKWCIYRVPRRLRDVQDTRKAYVPQTVSIGPYHLGCEQVRDIDCHKWVALNHILELTGQDFSLYLDSIKAVEEKARTYYKEEFVHLSSNMFVEMMVLDGCFILELFRSYPRAGDMGNPVFTKQKIIDDILLDMVKLENQIPFFIIDKLLRLMCMTGNPDEHQKDQAIALALNFFNPEWLTGKPMSTREFNEMKFSLQQEECLHLLDVFRRSLLHAGPQQDTNDRHAFPRRVCNGLVTGFLKRWLHDSLFLGYLKRRLHANRAPKRVSRHGQIIHSVTQLREGGVKFRKWNTNCFWDIRFKNGVLEIPTIWIQDSTMTILLNVAAFEHCHLKISDAVIASYMVFMECLIKSPEDVSHLHRCGILQHLLGHDSEVVDMFKNISKEILVDAQNGHYAKLSEQVNAYYNQKSNRWRASLLHKYFNNPWAITSLVAAFILLLLTALQSFYAIYSYYRPSS
ncbi:UPF0481 protein At3g47200 [Beta vulgaris subsp. vulgaris]|uniref:UPF0481 protein At3g47200 n=1 Tax=Beta vulgaris subsp. vulgaris TaxID=3555 RepID=UPI0020373FC6|nr:UPF0481 protein At3g47200 [Beta vulgaris subsp. vulgaris]